MWLKKVRNVYFLLSSFTCHTKIKGSFLQQDLQALLAKLWGCRFREGAHFLLWIVSAVLGLFSGLQLRDEWQHRFSDKLFYQYSVPDPLICGFGRNVQHQQELHVKWVLQKCKLIHWSLSNIYFEKLKQSCTNLYFFFKRLVLIKVRNLL